MLAPDERAPKSLAELGCCFLSHRDSPSISGVRHGSPDATIKPRIERDNLTYLVLLFPCSIVRIFPNRLFAFPTTCQLALLPETSPSKLGCGRADTNVGWRRWMCF